MKISEKGKKLIVHFEAVKLTAYKVTDDGNWTIGIGSERYADGKPVKEGDRISREQAITLFETTLPKYEAPVNRLVKKPLTQPQFDALVSFAYNVGEANFKSSTLLKKVNADPNDKSIAAEFAKWNKSKGRVLNGLVKRRSAESHYYFTGEVVGLDIYDWYG